MATTAPELDELTDRSADEDIRWDLGPLVADQGDSGASQLIAYAVKLAQKFNSEYAGRIAELDSAGLVHAMRQLGDLLILAERAGMYAELQFEADTRNENAAKLMQSVHEQTAAIETQLVFLELEWAALPDEQAARLLSDPELEFCAHNLRLMRRYRPHLLSEGEEKALAETLPARRGAWTRLFTEQTSTIEVKLPDRTVTLFEALPELEEPSREHRRMIAERISEALQPGLKTRALIYNTLVQDQAVTDRLKRFPSWLSDRNLQNEASDESVQALVAAVRGRYDIPQRWYRLKARLLGVEKLADYDRAAPLPGDHRKLPYEQARELVQATYDDFSPQAGEIIRGFFERPVIDVLARPGKRGGAFCASMAGFHPYVLLNYTGQPKDVLTLAHELGHGLHAVLSIDQSVFHNAPPLTVAETASVFGETLVFGRLLDRADEHQRLALLAQQVDDSMATVFRQVAMNQFEQAVHTTRRETGELTVDQLGELWARSQAEMFGDSVEITDGYRAWWSYVPHFINTPGYVYAYAYGQLLALSAYARYQQAGDEFIGPYLQMLACGASRPPEQLGQMIGVDLSDPEFWNRGLQLVEDRLRAAEDLADSLDSGV